MTERTIRANVLVCAGCCAVSGAVAVSLPSRLAKGGKQANPAVATRRQQPSKEAVLGAVQAIGRRSHTGRCNGGRLRVLRSAAGIGQQGGSIPAGRSIRKHCPPEGTVGVFPSR